MNRRDPSGVVGFFCGDTDRNTLGLVKLREPQAELRKRSAVGEIILLGEKDYYEK
jgi:hypothetical protein